jgi:phospholipid transport system substrate-binding protein
VSYFRYVISFFLFLTVSFLIAPLAESETKAVKEVNEKAEAGKEPVKELGEAAEVIRKFNDTLLESMKKGEALSYSERFKLLEPVVKDTFSFYYMAVKSTGNYWKSFSKEQKWLIIQKYTEWTTATYAGRFNEYDNEKFEVVSEEKNRSTVSVKSNIIKEDGEKVEFVYRLRKFDDKWKVIDILLQGNVSQLALTRSQFIGILDSDSYEGLLAMFQKKIDEFAKSHE